MDNKKCSNEFAFGDQTLKSLDSNFRRCRGDASTPWRGCQTLSSVLPQIVSDLQKGGRHA